MCAVVAHAAGTANKTRIIRALLDNISRRRDGERRARIAALRSAVRAIARNWNSGSSTRVVARSR